MTFAIHTSPNPDESFVDQLARLRYDLVLALIEGFRLCALTVGGLRRRTWSSAYETSLPDAPQFHDQDVVRFPARSSSANI